MTPELFLQECATMTYAGRMRRMVEIGRLAADDESIQQILATLAQGDVYQRSLAVQSCYGSHDAAQARLALADPSRSVRAIAVDLVAILCDDEHLQEILETLAPDLRLTLIRYLCKSKRQAPVDAYLETLAAHQDAQFKKLLPLGSHECVSRHLEQVIERFDQSNWQRLIRRHPDLAVTYLQRQSAQITTRDLSFLHIVNMILPMLTEFTPDLALALVRTTLKHTPLGQLNIMALVRKRPQEMADLVLDADESVSANFHAVAHKLDTERLVALVTRRSLLLSNYSFQRLTPSQRLPIYKVSERGWRNDEGILRYEIVAALPAEQRSQEGRRHLELPALATRPQVRLRYAAFLPWDEARALLDSALRSNEAEMRAVTLQTLIAATRYQTAYLPHALQLVRNRRNEQDPVRREMLAALAELPYGRWRKEHLPELAQIIRDALDAADLSAATAQVMGKLVIHLLPFYPEWCAAQLATIYKERGLVNRYQLDSILSDSDTRHIAPALLPLLQAWQVREKEQHLLTLGLIFGRRLRVFDELADILATLLEQTQSLNVATTITNLFELHLHKRLLALVPTLLARDESYVIISTVYNCLHRHRQDLLTPYLGQRTYQGKFTTGQVHIALNLYDGFYRWTPEQQDIFAHTLLALTHDEAQSTPVLQNTITRLAAMPAIDPNFIIQFASDQRQPIRDTALRAIGKLDAGQGIPTLFEAMNDDRARIAIYVLRHSLLNMPSHEALAILRAMPLNQVTVGKEIVRLIGDLASEEAYQELLTLTQRELHRDVRVALLRALWPYLERTETWDVLTQAAQSPERAQALGVISIPVDGMSLNAQKQLTNLFTILLAHPDPEVRVATLNRCASFPFRDPEHTLHARLLQMMQSELPDESSTAANAIFAIYTGNDIALVGNAVRQLLNNRRALHTVIESFVSRLYYNRKHLLATTRTIQSVLVQDPLTISWRLKILIWGFPWPEVIQGLIELAPALHADALVNAESLIDQLSRRPDASLAELETALATQADERLRRLALAALLAQTRQAKGWSDEYIQRLQTYQRDSSPLVAEKAQFTFPV